MYANMQLQAAASGPTNQFPLFAPMESGHGLGVGGSVRSVLIVDDSLVERENLKSILSASSISVAEADSGESALATAERVKPDLIFLDIMMPGMDGFAVCRDLHGDEQTKAIPVVMVSSKDNRSDKVWAEQMGAVAYITKPYSAEDILAVIRKVG